MRFFTKKPQDQGTESYKIGEKKPFIGIMQHYYALFVRHVEMITLGICNGSKFQLRKLRSRK
jgi:hypothetical protein